MDALADSVPDEPDSELETVILAEKGMLKRALEIIDAAKEKKAVLSSKGTLDKCMEEAVKLGAKNVIILDDRKVWL